MRQKWITTKCTTQAGVRSDLKSHVRIGGILGLFLSGEFEIILGSRDDLSQAFGFESLLIKQ